MTSLCVYTNNGFVQLIHHYRPQGTAGWGLNEQQYKHSAKHYSLILKMISNPVVVNVDLFSFYNFGSLRYYEQLAQVKPLSNTENAFCKYNKM